MNQPWVYMCPPFWTPLLPSSPSHPSGSSQCTGPEHPDSCIEPGLAIYFTYGNIHISMLFSQIIPPWVHFCTWYKVRVQLHSFACGYPVVLTLPIEESSLSPLKKWSWHPYWKSDNHRYMGLHLDSEFRSIDLYVYPSAGLLKFQLSALEFWAPSPAGTLCLSLQIISCTVFFKDVSNLIFLYVHWTKANRP